MTTATQTQTVAATPEELDRYLANAKTLRAETMRGFGRRLWQALTDSHQRPQRLADA